MAAPQPTYSIVESAPAVPPLQKTEPALVNYLSSLALWATQRLQVRLPVNQASPFLLLHQSDATPGTTPKVYQITVDGTGTIHATVMTLGKQP